MGFCGVWWDSVGCDGILWGVMGYGGVGWDRLTRWVGMGSGWGWVRCDGMGWHWVRLDGKGPLLGLYTLASELRYA